MSGPGKVRWRRIMRALSRRRDSTGSIHTDTDPSCPVVEGFRGVIDTPSEDVVERWLTTFRGWALHGSQPAEAVEIVLNGTLRFAASMGSPRPDIPRNLGEPDASEQCGWHVEIDLALIPAGPLHIQAVAREADGEPAAFVDRLITLSGDGFAYGLDDGRDGDRLDGGMLTVRGWAVIGWRYPTRVDIEVDDTPPAPARLRQFRKNNEPVNPLRGRPAAGFEFSLPLSVDGPRTVDVGITIVGRDGECVRTPIVRLRSRTPSLSRQHVLDTAAVQPAPQAEVRHELERFLQTVDRAAQRSRLNIPSDAIVLLSFGRHDRGENPLAAVESFCDVAAVNPQTMLVIVAELDDRHASAIKEVISRASLRARILIVPTPLDPREIITVADVFVSVSDLDSVSLVMADAMTLGIPVAASDTPKVRALVEDDVDGWLFGPRDIRALTACLFRVLRRTPDQRAQVGRAGMRRVAAWRAGGAEGEAGTD
jgi:glycosyltransferase involved in cell wall biosynthesis